MGAPTTSVSAPVAQSLGRAFSFGTTDYLAYGAGWGTYFGQGSFTFASWCLPQNAGTRRVLTGDYTSGGGNLAFELEIDASNAWKFYTSDIGSSVDAASFSGATTSPTLVVCRFVLGVGRDIWVNGVKGTPSTLYCNTLAAGASKTLGGAGLYPGSINWNGFIADVYGWNRALSDAEIWALFDPSTRWSLYAPLVKRTVVDGAGGGGSQALAGSPAVSSWAIAGALGIGAVALSGSPTTATWATAGTFAAGVSALSGSAAVATWTTPTQALAPGAVALVASPAVASWTVPSGTFAAGAVALSGSTAAATWTVPSGTFTAGGASQALSGAAAASTWSVPSATFAAGAVALSGSPASAAWSVPSGALASGVALIGSPATATWTVPSGTFTGAVALSGASAAAAWTVTTQTLGLGSVALVGSPSVATWLIASGTFGDPGLSIVADPENTWRARARDLTWRAKARDLVWRARRR